jgi:SM-20-related protein
MDLLFIEDFLDAATCAAMIDELRVADVAAATTYGGAQGLARSVEVHVRKTTRVAAPLAARQLVDERLRERIGEVAAHFRVELSEHEEPQFLRYDEGDFFVAHQDGNTSMTLVDRLNRRLVSAVVFLSDPSAYGGGQLVFHRSFTDRMPVTPPAGTLVAFRSESTHEVLPVTGGERYTIASWYR